MSSSQVRLKKSAVSGKAPELGDLSLGELAINYYDGSLYTKQDTGGVGIATTITNLTPWQETYGGGSLSYTGNVDISGGLDVTGVSTFTGDANFQNVSVGGTLSLSGAGSQFFAYNEDTIKVKFANWYSSNDRQYGMGQLWFETWFAAIDNNPSLRDNRRIGFYLEEPNNGSSDSGGTSNIHPTNDRMHIDINGVFVSDSLEVGGDLLISGVSTFTGDVTFSANINSSGVVTATSFHGDGSNLTGLVSGVGISSNSTSIGYGITSFNIIGTGVTINTSSNEATISFPTTRLKRQSFTATASQTTFNVTDYNLGYVDVFRNGVRLEDDRDYTASTGNTIVLTDSANLNDNIDIQVYESLNVNSSNKIVRQSNTATSGQTSFTITGGYEVGLIDVYLNGLKLNSADFTASTGSTVVLTEAASEGDILDFTIFRAVSLTHETKIDRQVYDVTSSTSSFAVTLGYTVGIVDVYLNGLKLINGTDYTATDGSNVVLTSSAINGDTVEIVAPKTKNSTNAVSSVTEENFTGTLNQTVFTTTQSFLSDTYLQVFRNGVKLRKTDFTSTPGNTVTLSSGCNANDDVDIVIFL